MEQIDNFMAKHSQPPPFITSGHQVPPPFIPKCHKVFHCKVDNRQFLIPIIFWCIFDIVILIFAPNIMWGIFGVLFGTTPLLFVLILARLLYGRITYTVNDNVLRINSPLKTLAINIADIKKIRRGRFWIERGRNYSASYIKLRIVYGRNSYIYISPDNEESFVRILQTINPNIGFSSERGL